MKTPIELALAEKIAADTDISGHLHYLRFLASGCKTVVEFGVRYCCSTIAFAAGLADAGGGTLYSYDHKSPLASWPKPEGVKWVFRQEDTGNMPLIPECDLLFIDTLHTYAHVKKELLHASQARIVAFHDTALFGFVDEGGGTGPGIVLAVEEFMSDNPEWKLTDKFQHNNGLWVIRR